MVPAFDRRRRMMADRAVLVGRTILQIVPELEAGGVERTAVDVAAALVAAGARAVVASQGGRLVAELEAAGATHAPFPAATKNPLAMAVNIGRLAALARSLGAELIHARSRAPAWVALAACRRLGLPFVTTWAGTYKDGGRLKRLYNSVMARGDAVIANSRFTGRRIERDFPWAADRISVIERGTDLARFDPARVGPQDIATLRSAWQVPPDARIVLCAARLTGWKGQGLLLEALARLGDPRIVAVLAGDAQGRNSYVAELRERAAALGLAGRVVFAGHVAEMPAAIAAADAVAVPSIEPEAFGRTAVEAQAMGRPVVVADHGAPAETVLAPPDCAAEARTGWRVKPRDAAALAEGLAAALAVVDRAGFAARARAHAGQFSLQAMTGATLDVYARLISSRQHPRP